MNKEDCQTETPALIAGMTTDPPSIQLDYAMYEHYLEHSDLSEAQKREFLETLWSIIVAFVDVGFGVHPLQQVCGEQTEPNNLPETGQAQCDKDKGLSKHHNQSKQVAPMTTAFASAHQENQERRQE